MKKTIYLVNSLMMLAVILGGACYSIFGGLWLKGLASGLFLVLGALNLIYAFKTKTKERMYAIFMVVGLFFSMLGDILLNVEFIAGAALFAVGHIFYFVAYYFVEKFKTLDLIICGSLAIVSTLIVTFVKAFDFGSHIMEAVIVIYAIIISTMLGKAITNLIRKQDQKNVLVVIGSALFFFSDLMLLLNVFLPTNGLVFDVLCLATYYPAQCVLAASLLYTETPEENVKEETETVVANEETLTESQPTQEETAEVETAVKEEVASEDAALVVAEEKPKTATRKPTTKKAATRKKPAAKKTTSTKKPTTKKATSTAAKKVEKAEEVEVKAQENAEEKVVVKKSTTAAKKPAAKTTSTKGKTTATSAKKSTAAKKTTK